TGTINETDYDGLGRVKDTEVGTNASNMVMESQDYYDESQPPNEQTGVGDGNLSETIQSPGGGAIARKTTNFYDWRDRLVASKQGVQPNEDNLTHRPVTYTAYDNLNEPISQQQYDG